jgi:hypothetical protein
MPALLTAGQHRALAKNLLATAGTPRHPSKDRAEQVACRHEVTAKIFEAHWLAALAFIGTRRPLVPADPI